jgi:2-keto-4-pentenoate hydratase/2-oxohepta-3-ene-1,7-dioic acid hydratase in catechol pathway
MKRFLTLALLIAFCGSAAAQISDAPDTPFKLASFEAGGETRVGLLLGERLLDVGGANAYLIRDQGLAAVDMPVSMIPLIEQYDRVRPRLYQIANYFSSKSEPHPFAYAVSDVALKAPLKYPWNLVAAAVNYRAHAAEMGSARAVDPDRDAPYMFAKSPRSSIADPGTPYVIPPGRDKIDWEGELAVVMAKPATRLTLDNAMDYVFGFTIMYDVSDRAPPFRQTQAYNVDWFSGKSRDGAAPMGPYIVPKEFLPNYKQLRITTHINDRVVQDSDTSYMIYDVEHLIRFVTSIMTLYPGDVISTGTPDGVGAGRKPPEFLKAGDTVTIDVEGVGRLSTPIR